MLNMLVVDDDKFEREGVRFLVEKYALPLRLAEADSGERALAYLEEAPVDILFSDIRMKGMDGLRLAEQVRQMRPDVKVIFMSAYGEFEYAQRAIDLQAIRYILKPVDVEAFLNVLQEAIDRCQAEKRLHQEQEKLQHAYQKERNYNKHRLHSGWITGWRDQPLEAGADLQMTFGFAMCRMILLDASKRVFDRLDLDLDHQLAAHVQRRCEIVHLHECQSLLLVEAMHKEDAEVFAALADRLCTWFGRSAACSVTAVVSALITDVGQLHAQYEALEDAVEYRAFFVQEPVLLVERVREAPAEQVAILEDRFQEIMLLISRQEYELARMQFDSLFELLHNSAQISVVYVKHLCMEIIRAGMDTQMRLQSVLRRTDTVLPDLLVQVHRTTCLGDLRQLMMTVFTQLRPTKGENDERLPSRAIEEALEIIRREFHTDLSLETLAERIYLTPNYLSHLFKKQTGVSVVKYMTALRLERARELLLTTHRKIIDISQEVGYPNYPYFGSLFKSRFGKTPGQFREGDQGRV